MFLLRNHVKHAIQMGPYRACGDAPKCVETDAVVFEGFASPQVYQASFWMGHYGALTMKRHVVWANAPTIRCLDLGTMTKEQQKNFNHNAKSTKKYKNKRGQSAYCGSKFLKQTGRLASLLHVSGCDKHVVACLNTHGCVSCLS